MPISENNAAAAPKAENAPEPAASQAPTGRSWFARRPVLVVAALSSALLLVGVSVAVASIISGSELATARDAYVVASSEYQAAVAERTTIEAEASAVIAAESVEEEDDPLLLDEIRRKIQALQSRGIVALVNIEDEADAVRISILTAELVDESAVVRAGVREVEEALTPVVEGRAARALTLAVARLDGLIAEAESTLAESEGRVSDEQVQRDLELQLELARAARDNDRAEAGELDLLAMSLRTAIDVVLAARAPAFTDVQGTWCYWENIAFCVTIDLPRVGDSVVLPPGADSFYPARGDGWTYVVPGEPCFTTVVGDPSGDPFGSAVFTYCPRDVSSGDQFQNFNNPRFERIYISQQGAIDPYFRIDEWSAATGR